MATSTKYIIGTLILIIFATYITIQLGQEVKLKVSPTTTTFYVFENNKWNTSGIEYNFIGNLKLNNSKITQQITGKAVTITRENRYGKVLIVDNYYFDGSVSDKELFPIRHTIEIFNATGLNFKYEVKKLAYYGVSKSVTSPMSFGKNMKLNWQDGYTSAKISAAGTLDVIYKINSNYQLINVRLFDPVIIFTNLTDHFESLTGGFNATFWNGSNWDYQNSVFLPRDTVTYFDSPSSMRLIDNATTNYIRIGTQRTINNNFIISAYFKYWNASGNYLYIAVSHPNTSALEFCAFGASAGVDATHWFYRKDSSYGTTTATINSSWNKFTIRVNSSTCSYSLNDEQVDAPKTNFVKPNSINITIWAGGLNNNNVFNVDLFNLLETIDYSLTPDNSANNNSYEYQTTATLTTGFPLIDVLDNTNRYSNYTVVGGALAYKIDILRQAVANLAATIVNVSIDNRTDLYRATFNISAPNQNNVELTYAGGKIKFPGNLNGINLTQTQFIFAGTNYTSLNLSFSSAEVKTIYINFSSQGNSSRVGMFNLTLTGFPSATGFSFTERFQNDTNYTAARNGTHFPIGSINGNNNTLEGFDNNVTFTRWQGGNGLYSLQDCYGGAAGYTPGIDPFGGDANCYGKNTMSMKPTLYSDYYDVSRANYITSQTFYYVDCSTATTSIAPYAIYELTDLTNTVTIFSDTRTSGCPGPLDAYYADWWVNMSILRINSTHIKYFYGLHSRGGTLASGGYNGVIDVHTLNTPYYLRQRIKDEGVGSGQGPGLLTIKNFNVGGAYLNISNSTVSGMEGQQSATHTGNYTSPLLNITSANITSMTLNPIVFIPSGTSISYYLSNDNGTTWENTLNDTGHLFSSVGNMLRVRFALSSTNNYTTPIVLGYTVSYSNSPISSLRITLGSTTTYNYPMNATNTPQYYSDEANINLYIFNYCANLSYCLIPLALQSGSAGYLQLNNLILKENINPVKLNVSAVQNLNIIQINSSVALNFSDFQFDYRGSKNITVVAHDAGYVNSQSVVLRVYYSPFNLSFYPPIQYWELFPKSRNETNIQPYGQNSTQSIWQLHSDAYHNQGTDVYVKYNNSVVTCVNKMLFVGWNNTANKQLNVTMTTTAQKLIENANSSTDNIWTYTDINCNATVTSPIVPLFCFFSLCTNCTKTTDWSDNCDVYE